MVLIDFIRAVGDFFTTPVPKPWLRQVFKIQEPGQHFEKNRGGTGIPVVKRTGIWPEPISRVEFQKKIYFWLLAASIFRRWYQVEPTRWLPSNPLSLVLTEGVRGSHRVASIMLKLFGQLTQILVIIFHYGRPAPHSATQKNKKKQYFFFKSK